MNTTLFILRAISQRNIPHFELFSITIGISIVMNLGAFSFTNITFFNELGEECFLTIVTDKLSVWHDDACL